VSKFITIAAVVLFGFMVITQPDETASMVRDAAQALGTFVRGLTS
jgi:hypothetical protein